MLSLSSCNKFLYATCQAALIHPSLISKKLQVTLQIMTLLSVWFPLDFLTSSVVRNLLSKSGSNLIQITSPIEWEKLGTIVWVPANRMGSGGWLNSNLPFKFRMQTNLSTLLTEALKSMTALQTKK